MQAESETYIDKSNWPRGEWDREPDRMQFADEVTGYPCLIVRNQFGVLCGYVGVPAAHPFHGKGYDDLPVDVHGGLTYAAECQEGGKICHKVEPGEPDDVWWFGFDCAHGYDMMPNAAGMPFTSSLYLSLFGPEDIGGGLTYRNLAYVQGQIRELAEQLKALA